MNSRWTPLSGTFLFVAGCAVALAGCGGGARVGDGPSLPSLPTTAPIGSGATPTPAPGTTATPAPGAIATPAPGATASPAPGSTATPAPGTTATSAPGATATPAPGSTATPAPGTTATPAPGATVAPAGSATANPIKHIVILIQENRSFDNLFHGFSEPSGRMADYATYGYDKAGDQIPLQQVTFETYYGPSHGHADFFADYDNGKNDGFYDNNGGSSGSTGNGGLAYLDQTEIQPYFDMASSGALAERFFHGVTASTWSSHLMFVAGSTTYDGNPADRVIGNPQISLGWGCEDGNPNDYTGSIDANNNIIKGPFPCFTGVRTIVDNIQAAGHTWHYYSGPVQAPGVTGSVGGNTLTTPGGNLEALATYRQIYYGPTWTANAIQPETRILTDVAAGTLADVTWVVPEAENSDIAEGGTATGPQWVASVVNAIGTSQFYNNTVIFVTWDDWGGWYDHVPPPQKYGYFGLGFRIPLIAISPYAKHGQIVDTQLEPGSILKFAEDTFNLPSLGTTDSTSNSADAMLDFTQSPAPFTAIASSLKRDYFLHRKIDYRVVDDDGGQ